jgi:hypothetical protein
MKDYEVLIQMGEIAFGRAFAEDLRRHYAAYHDSNVLLNTFRNSLARRNREFLDLKAQRDELYAKLHSQERLI